MEILCGLGEKDVQQGSSHVHIFCHISIDNHHRLLYLVTVVGNGSTLLQPHNSTHPEKFPFAAMWVL